MDGSFRGSRGLERRVAMLLKSVEMQGFKSFADKIYLDFNPGITAIVGPNGSGKSNISDAIRWVMGEQSIKTLRGSKMEDVIFSGTQSRKPMGFAEVSLTLDNSEKFFSLDYEEITVTRRVYRSGEGEYFINRVSCRLKDIHELFMDTGLGREGYSIIGQGKIDEILSNKSEDRRQIFEEAAGITKYKYRKTEAERKLSHTTENLTRVKDIMAELENQIGPLFEQSEKAKKYLKLRDELKTVEVNLSVVKIDKLRVEAEALAEALLQTDAEIEKIRAEVEANERTQSEIYESISLWDAEMEKCRESEKNIIESIGDSNGKISVLLADIGHYEENIKKLNESVEALLNQAAEAEKVLAGYEEELDGLLKRAEEIKSRKELGERKIKEMNELSETKNERLESIKSEIIELGAQIGREKERIINSELLKESFLQRSEAAKKELLEKSGEYDRFKSDEARLSASLKEKEESVKELENARTAAQAELNTQRNEHQGLLKQAEELNFKLNQKRSRRNILFEMEKSYEGFAGSVKAVMNAKADGRLQGLKIYGPFARLVKVSEKYTTAIDTALGNAGQNIVVETENDAKRAIDYLKETKAGRATFLPVSTVRERKIDISEIKNMKGYIALASELAEVDEKYSAIKSSLLGAVAVADNIDNAIELARASKHKIKIVTLSGEVMQPGGAMTGGFGGKSGGFLSRAAEIEALGEVIKELETAKGQTEASLLQRAESLEKIENKIDAFASQIAGTNDELIKIRADFEHYNTFSNNVAAAKKQLQDELDVINANLEKIAAENREREENIATTEQKIEALNEAATKEKDGFDKLLSEAREASERLVKMSIEENSCEKDIAAWREKSALAAQNIKDIAQRAQNAENEKASYKEKIAIANAEIESGKTDIKQFEEITAAAKERLLSLSTKKAEAEEKSRALQKEITGTNDIMLGLSSQKTKTETKKTKIDAELEGIFNRLWEEYELSYSAAAEAADENADLTNAEKDILSLKSKIKNLGNINIDAIESYREIKERYDFLLIQTNDLEKAKIDLEKVIAEMLLVMKKQFAQQFEIINRNFSKVFSELFGGGQANLSLADPENLLESGIEIEAQPPGKKLQRLSLLSGGERALTAIALLFAILNVRPTPFCILDEIEAALDDVNVGRYADYLRKYSQNTQFIVVTHRRGTMEAANVLYGVTMQERGVSKLLSLNIDEVAK